MPSPNTSWIKRLNPLDIWNKHIARHRALMVGCICTLTVFGLGVIGVWHLKYQAEKVQTQSVGDELLRIAKILAKSVDWNLHEKAKLDPNPQSRAYRTAIAPLLSAHKALPEIQYIYTFQADATNTYIVLDTMNFHEELGRQPEPIAVMEPYKSEDPQEDADIQSALLLGKEYLSKKPVKDKHGTLFSVIAPIPHPLTNKKTYSGVGIDLTETILQARLKPVRWASATSLLWIALAALGCGAFTTWITHRATLATIESHHERKIRLRSERERELLAAVAEKTSQGILLADAQGITQWANKSFSQITGFSPEELIGKIPGRCLQGEKTSAKTRADIRLALEEKRSYSGEILNYKKDKTPYWAHVNIQPLFAEDGTLLHWIGLHSDITERKKNERELKDAKIRAEDSNRAKSEFLAVMSHEIRTPLNGVVGSCQLMRTTQPTPEQEEYLGYIESCGQNLLETINEVLDFSKIEAGKADPEPEDFSPGQVLEQILGTHQAKAKNKGIAIHLHYNKESLQIRSGEKGKILQVVNNLISNAVKFTDKGEVTITATTTGNILEILVKDSGPGIPEEKQKSLFEPFIRGDASHTRKHRGTGLGLTIAKKLTEFCKGELLLQKTSEAGTIFLCRFPLQAPLPSDDKDRTQPIERPLLKNEILIVEDNLVNQKILEMILKKKGQTCDTALDGTEAVKKCETKAYDLIFMDIQMPNLDGIEATRLLRKLGYKGSIIALTATTETEEMHNCFAAGMQEFMTKPFHEKTLHKFVEKYGKQKKS